MELPPQRSVKVSSWHIAKALFSDLHGYVFRGQGTTSWPLSPSFERAAKRFHATDKLRESESLILGEFQRRAHHYLQDVPQIGECVEWLALIQHYGGPTRLLDFTHSAYVASFFAMESATEDAVVWAVDANTLRV